MAGVGAPVIFVFQKLRSSAWFNRDLAMLVHSNGITKSTSHPAVLAHNRSDLDCDGTRADLQLVNGSSMVALARRVILRTEIDAG